MSDLDVIKTALETAGVQRVYKINEVGDKAYPYAVLSPAPGAPQVRTLDGSGNMVGRFVIQFFSRTEGTLTDSANIAIATFDGHVIPGLPGEPVAWLEINSSVYRDPDTQGVLNVTQTYRV